jgi:hypothetical protein
MSLMNSMHRVRIPRSTVLRTIANIETRQGQFRNKSSTATSNFAPPSLSGGGTVKWTNQKGSRSFGVALDAMPVTSSPEHPFEKATEAFPGALSNADLVEKISTTLAAAGIDMDKIQLATSLCCDEVNRPLELALSSRFHHNFNIGGLAGFPFGGVTGFGAMASHIPDGGSCLVVYGPHVGVDSTGAVGTVERRGRASGGNCCGSAVAASNFVSDVFTGEKKEGPLVGGAIDAQQHFVNTMLLPYAEKLENSNDRMTDLPYALYEAQSRFLQQILDKAASNVGDGGSIAVLGGIQVNTPPEYSDYFSPLSFNIYNDKGELEEELW